MLVDFEARQIGKPRYNLAQIAKKGSYHSAMESEEDLTNAVSLVKATIIGGAPYRAGFIKAAWDGIDRNNPETLLRAKRENVLSGWRELYHYTSIAGLKGIVEENGFWASDNRFMNDAEESWNGIRLAREVLQHKAKRSRDPAFVEILRGVAELIAAPREHGHLVTCFSTARDDLGQWRSYAAGGVCLRLGEAREGETPLFVGPKQLPFAVIYEHRRKQVLLLSILRRFEREYALDRAAMPHDWPDDHDESYRIHLHSTILHHILGFKDPAFAHEAEARLVLSYEDADRYDGGLRFRASPLGIIPYLRTGDRLAVKKKGGRLPLREVIVGPSPYHELIAQSIEIFLRQSGYAETLVIVSQVPYRAP